MLKSSRTVHRQPLQKFIGCEVHLEFFVKVQPKWRQSRHFLTDFGYRIERD